MAGAEAKVVIEGRFADLELHVVDAIEREHLDGVTRGHIDRTTRPLRVGRRGT
jgi:hypothetical protein